MKNLQYVALCGYIVPTMTPQGGIKRRCSKEELQHGLTLANMRQIKTAERVLQQKTEGKKRHLKSERRLALSWRKAIRQTRSNGRRSDTRLKAATLGLF